MPVVIDGIEENIELNRETGKVCRRFDGRIDVEKSEEYQSVLVLAYESAESKFPNRVRSYYRNHFCVYTGVGGSIVVVRSETTLKYRDNDANLQYTVLK